MKNELRLGNLLLGSMYFDEEEARQDLGEDYSEEEEWKITKVEGVPHESEICTAWTDEEYNRLEPIPITEEWLKKFGFEKFNNPNNTPSWVWKKNNEVWFFETWKDKDFFIKEMVRNQKNINYVHQLQNLYFALTGEELVLQEGVAL